MTVRYFEDVDIGDSVPTFQRETDLMHWNRYAAVNDEFVYIHMDDDAGKAAGQGGAFGMGNLKWAYVLNSIRAWTGDESEIRELGMQFRAINHKHDALRTSGIVTEKKVDNGENIVVLEINVLNQKDESTAPGRAIVVLPSRG